MIDFMQMPVKQGSFKLALAAACLLLASNALHASETKAVPAQADFDHQAEFNALHALAGTWLGVDQRGNEVQVDFRLTAGGSVLVETWTFANDRESLTLYHMDGERMIATHYCPIGNQPRLQLKRKLNDGTLEFEFMDATNLPDMLQAHEHAFDMQVLDADIFVRNETYLSDGESSSNGIRFTRQEGP